MKDILRTIQTQHGFTLIEILVATTILTMILTIVFGTFFYTVNNAEEQEERAAIYHRANFILNDISQSVSSAVIPFGGAGLKEEDEESVFLGETGQIEEHQTVSLSFFTSAPFYCEHEGIREIADISYEVVHSRDVKEIGWVGDKDNPLVLESFATRMFSDFEDGDERTPLWMLSISSIGIEYSDGADWLSTWNYEDQEALPRAVRIQLELTDSNGTTHSFSTATLVHVNAPLDETS